MDFLERIKKEIRPGAIILEEADKFVAELNRRLAEKKIKAKCVKGGSVAKGTFLKGDFDIDLFVKFDYTYKNKQISDILESVLKDFLCERIHGSRDYFQIKKDKMNYEIVPVLDVKDPKDAINVTDMSPMHVDWVKSRLKKGGEDEIRLAKKFCKGTGVYGAESYISGFSGHTIDILVIRYNGFLNLLKAACKWKSPVIIDTERYYNGSRQILLCMNQSKISGPMIIVDPLLKTRNAASALSYEKFALFKKKAQEFLKKPDEKFFIEEEVSINAIRKKHRKNLVIISLTAKDGKRDVAGSRILKANKFMKAELTKLGFQIKDSGWLWNQKKRVLFWIVIKETELPETMIIKGPPVEMKEHAQIFRKKYKKNFAKDGKLYAEIKVAKRDVSENLKRIFEMEYIKDLIEFEKIE